MQMKFIFFCFACFLRNKKWPNGYVFAFAVSLRIKMRLAMDVLSAIRRTTGLNIDSTLGFPKETEKSSQSNHEWTLFVNAAAAAGAGASGGASAGAGGGACGSTAEACDAESIPSSRHKEEQREHMKKGW